MNGKGQKLGSGGFQWLRLRPARLLTAQFLLYPSKEEVETKSAKASDRRIIRSSAILISSGTRYILGWRSISYHAVWNIWPHAFGRDVRCQFPGYRPPPHPPGPGTNPYLALSGINLARWEAKCPHSIIRTPGQPPNQSSFQQVFKQLGITSERPTKSTLPRLWGRNSAVSFTGEPGWSWVSSDMKTDLVQ